MSVLIQVAPTLDLALVTLQGVIQVHDIEAKAHCQCEVRGVTCWGFCMDDLPLPMRFLELKFRLLTDRWIAQMSVQGYEAIGSDVRIHGPFASYDYMNKMANEGSADWKDATRPDQNGDPHPELYLPFVHERDSNPGFRDYVLVHQFLKREVLTEIPLETPNDPS